MTIAKRTPFTNAGRRRGSESSTSPSRSRRARRAASLTNTQSTVAIDEPTIEELRRARTTFYCQKDENRQKRMDRDSAHQVFRRRDLVPKSVSSRDSKVRVSRSSERPYPDRRRRRRRFRTSDGESSIVNVYPHAHDTNQGLGAAMPRATRRASNSVASSGRGERRRTAEKAKMNRPESRTESLARTKSSQGGGDTRSSLYITETVVRTIKRRSLSADAAPNARTHGPRVTR